MRSFAFRNNCPECHGITQIMQSPKQTAFGAIELFFAFGFGAIIGTLLTVLLMK